MYSLTSFVCRFSLLNFDEVAPVLACLLLIEEKSPGFWLWSSLLTIELDFSEAYCFYIGAGVEGPRSEKMFEIRSSKVDCVDIWSDTIYCDSSALLFSTISF